MKKITFYSPIDSPNQSCRVYKGNIQLTNRTYNLTEEPFVHEDIDINGTYTIICDVNGEQCIFTKIIQGEKIVTTYKIYIVKDRNDNDISEMNSIVGGDSEVFYVKSERTSGVDTTPHTVTLNIISGSSFISLSPTTLNFNGDSQEYIPITITTDNVTNTSNATVGVSTIDDNIILDDVNFDIVVIPEPIPTPESQYLVRVTYDDNTPINNRIEVNENIIIDLKLKIRDTLNNYIGNNITIKLTSQNIDEHPQPYIIPEYGNFSFDGLNETEIDFAVAIGGVSQTTTSRLNFTLESFDINNVILPNPVDIHITNLEEPRDEYNVELLLPDTTSVSRTSSTPSNLGNLYTYDFLKQTGEVSLYLRKEIISDNDSPYSFDVEIDGASIDSNDNKLTISDNVTGLIPIKFYHLEENKTLTITVSISENTYLGDNKPDPITYYIKTPSIIDFNITLDLDLNNNGIFTTYTNTSPPIEEDIPNGLPFTVNLPNINNGTINYNKILKITVINNNNGNIVYTLNQNIGTASTYTNTITDFPLSNNDEISILTEISFNIQVLDTFNNIIKNKTFFITNTYRNPISVNTFKISTSEEDLCDGNYSEIPNIEMFNYNQFFNVLGNNITIQSSSFNTINSATNGSNTIIVGKEKNNILYFREFQKVGFEYIHNTSRLDNCIPVIDYDIIFKGLKVTYLKNGFLKYDEQFNNPITPNSGDKYVSYNLSTLAILQGGNISNPKIKPVFDIIPKNDDSFKNLQDIEAYLTSKVFDLSSNYLYSFPPITIENENILLSDINDDVYDENLFKPILKRQRRSEPPIINGYTYEGLTLSNFEPDRQYEVKVWFPELLNPNTNINLFWNDDKINDVGYVTIHFRSFSA